MHFFETVDRNVFLSTVWALWVAALGASLGSFINVVVARLPEGQSIVRPRSRCPRCGASIAWFDNIPLLSYGILRARCRNCASPISAEYPLVEALAGGFALALWWQHDDPLLFAVDLAITLLLLTLALIDARHFLLPESLSLLLAAMTLIAFPAAHAAQLGLAGAWPVLYQGLAGAAAGAGLLALTNLLGTWYARRVGRIGPDEDAMGWGDVILIGAIGARVGPGGVLLVLFLASVQGAGLGSLWLWRQARRDPPKDLAEAHETRDSDDSRGEEDRGEFDENWQPPARAIPFGPFLALGCVEWMLFEQTLRVTYDRVIDGLVLLMS